MFQSVGRWAKRPLIFLSIPSIRVWPFFTGTGGRCCAQQPAAEFSHALGLGRSKGRKAVQAEQL